MKAGIVAALLTGAAAFPAAVIEEAFKREINAGDIEAYREKIKRQAVTFNPAQQYVSNTGAHKFVAPGPGDQRGPCPGLNALANHGYLNHNGIGTIQDFVTSTYTGFGMGVDLAGFLGVYGAIFDGDLTEYSIGFASAQLPVISGMLGTPQGLGGSHNNYENDASPIRGDLYTYGNSYLNQPALFQQFIDINHGVPENTVNYNLEQIKNFRKARFDHSIATNPYFFNGPFSGAIASTAAYTFMYRFMANKSAEYPEGRLSRNDLKHFYSMTGTDGHYTYTPGHEKFPNNWYKRAIGDEYTIPYFFADFIDQFTTYPEFLSIGGNLGKVNSFTGFDPGNLTGGVYDLSTLSQGNNAECFAFELTAEAGPSLLEGIFVNVTPAQNQLSAALNKYFSGLGCPKLVALQYNQKFKQFPGYSKAYDGYKGNGID